MVFRKTVDSIVGGLAKMEQQLKDLAIQKGNEAVIINEKIEVLYEASVLAREERDRASRVAKNISEITK